MKGTSGNPIYLLSSYYATASVSMDTCFIDYPGAYALFPYASMAFLALASSAVLHATDAFIDFQGYPAEGIFNGNYFSALTGAHFLFDVDAREWNAATCYFENCDTGTVFTYHFGGSNLALADSVFKGCKGAIAAGINNATNVVDLSGKILLSGCTTFPAFSVAKGRIGLDPSTVVSGSGNTGNIVNLGPGGQLFLGSGSSITATTSATALVVGKVSAAFTDIASSGDSITDMRTASSAVRE
jgi:hypothetical protein